MSYGQPVTDLHLDVPGARIAYSVHEGAAPTRVVAHGLTSSRAADDAGGFMPWAGLDTSARTVRYDARGHGDSTGRTVPDDWTWNHLADDLLALLDQVSPDEPVDALGASMGAATILWAAIRRPERFRRLVLVIPPTAWETRAAVGDDYRAGADLIERDGIAAWLDPAANEPQLALLTAAGFEDSAPPHIADALVPSVFRGAAMSDLPAPDAIATIAAPTLLLPWAGDPGHPVSTSEKLLGLLPDARLQVAETPEQLRAWPNVIEEFLGELA